LVTIVYLENAVLFLQIKHIYMNVYSQYELLCVMAAICMNR
jgi:hypothetical protein